MASELSSRASNHFENTHQVEEGHKVHHQNSTGVPPGLIWSSSRAPLRPELRGSCCRALASHTPLGTGDVGWGSGASELQPLTR